MMDGRQEAPGRDVGSGGRLAAFAAGAVAGAIVAVLLAPAVGRDLRRYLSEWTGAGRREGRAAYGRRRDHLRVVVRRSLDEPADDAADRTGNGADSGGQGETPA